MKNEKIGFRRTWYGTVVHGLSSAVYPLILSLSKDVRVCFDKLGMSAVRIKYFYTIVVTGVLCISLSISCVDPFSTRYERIDADRVRPIALVFEPAEAAPGDTVKMKVWFAGEPVDELHWSVSFDYIFNAFGVDTALDTFSLRPSEYYVEGSDTLITAADSLGTTYGTISFWIPQDIITENITITDDMLSGFAPEVVAQIPEDLQNIDIDSLIAFVDFITMLYGVPVDSLMEVESLSVEDLGIDPSTLGFEGADTLDAYELLALLKVFIGNEELQKQIALVSQILGMRMKVYLLANDLYRSESSFTIRYTSRMRFNPHAYINRNPVIDWVRVYALSDTNTLYFGWNKDKYDTVFTLYDRQWDSGSTGDTVLVDDGRVYFLAAKINTGSRDSAISLTDTVAGQEIFFFDWMYRNDTAVPGVPQDSLIIISNTTADSTVRLYPPVDTRMKKFTIWVTAYDWYLGEMLRPRGFAMREVSGVFAYTDRYRAKH